jgi:hypothetical protein
MMEEEEISSSTIESALLKLLNVLLKSESLGMNEGMELWSLSLSLSLLHLLLQSHNVADLSLL